MAKGDPEDLAAQAAKRAEFRLHHVGTKLNEREVRELEELLGKRGQTQGEFIRGLILAEIEREQTGGRPSVELIDLIGLRLLLVNTLRSLAQGKTMSSESYEDMVAQVRQHRARLAVERLRLYREKGE
jgi:hypothetical protein